MSIRIKFTKKNIEEITPSAKRQYFYDEQQKGLCLAVTSKGTKTFQFRGRGGQYGDSITVTLGRYGEVTISSARKRSAELLVDLKAGIDPQAEKLKKREELTLSEIFDQYIKLHAEPNKKSSSVIVDRRNFKNHFAKSLGGKRPTEISTDVVERWKNNIASTKGRICANRCVALLSTIFKKTLKNVPNPCRGVEKFKETHRKRVLRDTELPAFYRALSEEPQKYQDYFMLLLLTGVRKSNLLAMKWVDIHTESVNIVNTDNSKQIITISRSVWIIPEEESKNGSAITVPLISKAVEILASRENNGSEYVFPGAGQKGHLVDTRKSWERIKNAAGLQNLNIHDLRHSIASRLIDGNSSLPQVQLFLGHKSIRSTERYLQPDLDPVREQVEKVTTAMISLMEQK